MNEQTPLIRHARYDDLDPVELERLARDGSWQVRVAVAERDVLPITVADRLAQDEWPEVQRVACRHPLSPAVLEGLLASLLTDAPLHDSVVTELVGCPSLSMAQLERLLVHVQEENLWVPTELLEDVVRRPGRTDAVMVACLEVSDAMFASWVATQPALSPAVMSALAATPDPAVSLALLDCYPGNLVVLQEVATVWSRRVLLGLFRQHEIEELLAKLLTHTSISAELAGIVPARYVAQYASFHLRAALERGQDALVAKTMWFLAADSDRLFAEVRVAARLLSANELSRSVS